MSSDCMGKAGVIDRAFPLNEGHFEVGKTHYAYCDHESNWNVHKNIQDLEQGCVVFVDDLGANGRAIFGDIVTKYIINQKLASAVVSNGKARDIDVLKKENYPVWCSGSNPVGCFNTDPSALPDSHFLNERKEYFRDSIIVCDDTGAIVITKNYMNEDFLQKLEWIIHQERVWQDYINRRNWNTFDTICLKRYKEG